MEDVGVHYDQYKMKPEEVILTLIVAMGFLFLVGQIFYDNLYLSLFLSLFGVFYLPVRKKALIRQRKNLLNLQFKDALYFISVSLSAGKSMETALIEAQKALKGIYPDGESDMLKELDLMNARILMSVPTEKVIQDFAERAQIEDIKSFADVFSISRRAGANLVEVIKNTSATIREKIEVKQEIENIITGKRLEQKILTVMPFAMVFFIKNTSDGFLDPLFTTLAGRIVMTVALGMIAAAWLISRKIMNIEV
jgi:tight adherence protein B